MERQQASSVSKMKLGSQIFKPFPLFRVDAFVSYSDGKNRRMLVEEQDIFNTACSFGFQFVQVLPS